MKYVQAFFDEEKWYINENYIYSVSDIQTVYRFEGISYPVLNAIIMSWGSSPERAKLAVNADGSLKRFEFGKEKT